MKLLAKIILITVLILGGLIVPSKLSADAASTVPQGFYINNQLDLNLVDFQSLKKKEKRAYIQKLLVASNPKLYFGIVYDFKTAVQLPANVTPTGLTLAEYEKQHGPLVANPVSETFEVVGIEW